MLNSRVSLLTDRYSPPAPGEGKQNFCELPGDGDFSQVRMGGVWQRHRDVQRRVEPRLHQLAAGSWGGL
ncbi:hypothetical protein Plim_2358 [Planctopirus limnophila DSM 3776]|uniref:Uncharacterized protein n=1 Tax=Planctopirus limnophila (strain ATCC 43296 / DSM 3776 / IFAM 1008 / Mu 290) TaxID=521674 RepID=D5SP40_PLAL2|nr:hypothetical protein Plim_2358 [Planctopirus limnophila DSM 3776]